ncbi:hypothetical protein TH53_04345 [Pedobacter lusitanus]|uniref:Uncharacterized protein n=1 Tax=Pedobacter lusitanus TaxID=1503925 RepID=A0A0D0GLY5_9SPHI|nr:hypothetical protein TH53_04345 [Pedobacter lusitanus]
MKKRFYVNEKAQRSGDHEVHNESCTYLPILQNRRYLGEFYNCTDAVIAAKWYYPTADGCKICSEDCHTR